MAHGNPAGFRRWMQGSVTVLGLLLLIAGCRGAESTQAMGLPAPEAVVPWEAMGQAASYDSETLYDLVNGQADAYFAYGFEQVTVQRYRHANSEEEMLLDVEIWRLASPEDAYGLFTAYRAGEPARLGNDGDRDPGRRLAFWQSRFYVRVRALQETPSNDIETFGQAVEDQLPRGGQRPAAIAILPEAGLLDESLLFFHQEMSIQERLWLGGENVLLLGPETDGVLARYERGDGVGELLLVLYPDEDRGYEAGKQLWAMQPERLINYAVDDGVLVAAFGGLSEPSGHALVEQTISRALQDRREE